MMTTSIRLHIPKFLTSPRGNLAAARRVRTVVSDSPQFYFLHRPADYAGKKFFNAHVFALTTPQAIFFPEFPAGWVVKSSGMSWMTTVRPTTSGTVKRSV